MENQFDDYYQVLKKCQCTNASGHVYTVEPAVYICLVLNSEYSFKCFMVFISRNLTFLLVAVEI